MNNTSKNILRSLALTTLGIIYGCSDEFLKDENNQEITSGLIFNTPETINAAIIGVYDGFQSGSQGDPGIPNEFNVKGVFRMANNITLDWQDSSRRGESEFDRLDITANNDIATKIYPVLFRTIGRANASIFSLPDAISNGAIGAEEGNRLFGEVVVLRAIAYQYLAATYSNVPLVTSPTDDPFAGKVSQDVVFQQIIDDMNTVIPNLPWSQQEKGRVTKGTAYAVLGNAQMWLGQYKDAVSSFEEIEKGGVTDLESNYLDIHAVDNKNGKESLFEISWAANADLGWNRNDEVSILQLFAMPTDITGGGGFAGIPRKELYDSFEAGDLRREATVIGPGEEHPDPKIDISQYKVGVWTGTNDAEGNPIFEKDTDGNTIYHNTVGTVADPWTGAGLGDEENDQRTGYWGIKSWRDPSIEGWGKAVLFGSQSHIWIRYGEVLLSLAESAFKDGDIPKAQAAFDRVRNRAWGGTAPAKVVSMDNILEEYRHELGGEFSLWPVIRRSGEVRKYFEDRFPTEAALLKGEDLVVPIPNSAISINPNLK